MQNLRSTAKRLGIFAALTAVVFGVIAGALYLTNRHATADVHLATPYAAIPLQRLGVGALGVVPATAIALGTQTAAAAGLGDRLTAAPAPDPRQTDANPNLNPPPATPPFPSDRDIAVANQGTTSFAGLSHLDQRAAGTAAYANTQVSVEPPNPTLCSGAGLVLEAVSFALAVYAPSKGPAPIAGPVPFSQFLGLAPAFDRATNTAGPALSAAQCRFDPVTNHWFFAVLERDNGLNSGATDRDYLILAVSQSHDPTGQWSLLRFDVTADGQAGTTTLAGCPCYGGTPKLGLNNDGIFLTTDLFTHANQPRGAQVYALAKGAVLATLAGGALPSVAAIDAAPLLAPHGGQAYGLQPANPTAGDFSGDDANNQLHEQGIEYFASALDFDATLDNRVAVWALSGTATLDTPHPALILHLTVIKIQTYGQPPDVAQQSAAPSAYPLLNALKARGGSYTPEQLHPGIDRMGPVILNQGNLWGTIDTTLGAGAAPRSGVLFFKLHPIWPRGVFDATTLDQSYASAYSDSLLAPVIAVSAQERGAIAFTLVGVDHFPSAAFIPVNKYGPFGKLHVAAVGAGPEDGYSGYPPANSSGVALWSTTAAAVADPDGTIWMAIAYIPAGPRTALANWGTIIVHFDPTAKT